MLLYAWAAERRERHDSSKRLLKGRMAGGIAVVLPEQSALCERSNDGVTVFCVTSRVHARVCALKARRLEAH